MSQHYVILPPDLVPGLLAVLDGHGKNLGHGHVVILVGGLHKLRAISTGQSYQLTSSASGHCIWVQSRSYLISEDHRLGFREVKRLIAGSRITISPSGVRSGVPWWWMSSILAKMAATLVDKPGQKRTV